MSTTAVVILNWNGKAYLEKFIPSVLEHMPEGDVLYVADNGSQDGSLEYLRNTWPDVRLIVFDRNYGFTGGYNRAFDRIRSDGETFDYYLLLNSDIEVTPGWLDGLERFMDSHPRCAVCAPKILSYSDRGFFEHAGAAGGFVDRWYFPYCRGRILATVERDEGQYDSACKVFWASGAAFMIRSGVWHQLGGLDEAFFAHMEEIDLCWRAMLSGWEVWAFPGSKVYHVGGGTLPNNSPRKLYLNFRNNLLMMYKNLPERNRRRIIFSRMCVDGAIAAMYLLTGKLSFFKSVVRAHADYRRMRKDVTRTVPLCPVLRPVENLPRLVLRGYRDPVLPLPAGECPPAFYIRGYLNLFTRAFFRRRYKKILSSYDRLLPLQKQYVDYRVTYYNRLSGGFRSDAGPFVPSSAVRPDAVLGGARANSRYIFDTLKYLRYFPAKVRASYLFGDITYVPSVPSFVKSRPIAGDSACSVVLPLDMLRHFRFVRRDPVPFRKKQDRLIGMSYVGQPHRRRFMEMYFGHPMCDLGSINPSEKEHPEWIRPKISVRRHLDYKFVSCIEGNDVATNLKWVMSSDCLPVMPRPVYETWFMEGTLIPGYHYVEIRPDYSDLIEKMEYYTAHPEEAEEINRHGKEYAAQFADPSLERLIAVKVMEKYFRLGGSLS
ncbi:MAG TPA: glycosyltransferase [Candidatus Coprenecus stercoravium]|uniref:Glycosyltransferase n=1 Tax=Candidatus Coprenecus stercoravium TaxID=2840735 RepID=A0A9D2GPB6_9BACT|nr:glycosyltransferase [Candidatus Coprenecus stercoravium]